MADVKWSNNTAFTPVTTTISGDRVMGLNNGDNAKFLVSPTPVNRAISTWDANSNLSANNFLERFATIATAAGTTTLTVASAGIQEFTGSTTQTVVMPVTSTLVAGQKFFIINNSSGDITVNSSGSNLIQTMTSGTSLIITCVLTSGTTAASWDAAYISASGGGVTPQQVQSWAFNMGTDSGSANNYVVTLNPPITSYTEGFIVSFIPNQSSSQAAPFINVDGLGAQQIFRVGFNSLFAGDIEAGQTAFLYYGASFGFVLLNPQKSFANIAALQRGLYTLGSVTGGGADNYVIDINPPLLAYGNGMIVSFTPLDDNLTTTPVININGLGAKTIELKDGSAVAAGDVSTGQVATLVYSLASNSFLLLTPATGSSGGGVTSTQVQQGEFNEGTDSGTADNYVVTLSPPISAYTEGLLISFVPANNNISGSCFINVDGQGVVAIYRIGATNIYPNDLDSSGVAYMQYNSTYGFILLTPFNANASTVGVANGQYTTASISGGVADAYAVDAGAPIYSLMDGMQISFTPTATNLTTTPTLQLSAFATKVIARSSVTPVAIGDLSTGQIATVIYSSAANKYILLNPAI